MSLLILNTTDIMSTEHDTPGTEPNKKATNGTEQVTDEPGSNTTDNGAEEPQTKLTADEKKQQIVDSFRRRIDAGELKLEDVEDTHPWVADALTVKKEEQPNVQELAKQYAKEEAERIIKEREEKRQLEELDDAISEVANTDQIAELKKVEAQYSDALGAVEAKRLAAKLLGLDFSSQARRRRRMTTISEIGDAPKPDSLDEKIINQAQLSDKELIEVMLKKKGLA